LDGRSQPASGMASGPLPVSTCPLGEGLVPVPAAPPPMVSETSGLHQGAGIDGGNDQSTTTEQIQPVPSNSVRCGAMSDDMHTLHSEIENLRRSMAAQEDRIAQLKQEVDALRESEEKAVADAVTARDDVVRLGEELRQEREWRERAEIAAASSTNVGFPPADPKPVAPRDQTKIKHRSNSNSKLDRNLSTLDSKPNGFAPQTVLSDRPMVEHVNSGRRERVASGFLATVACASSKGTRSSASPPQRDDIDVRLNEYLARSDTGLTFRRLNRGWYAFRRADDRNSPSSDRSVEVSIVNGKLMARLEPTTHEKGWNNGKLGPIERFCAYFAQAGGE